MKKILVAVALASLVAFASPALAKLLKCPSWLAITPTTRALRVNRLESELLYSDSRINVPNGALGSVGFVNGQLEVSQQGRWHRVSSTPDTQTVR